MAAGTIEAVVATPREGKFNKNHARRVRVAGKIPAVVYGAGMDSVAVTVDPRVITKILHSESGHNTIFDLNVEGAAGVKAMIVDWQNEPIKGHLLHIDLKRIAMDKAMRVSVPIQLTGVPVGVKTQGGILEHVLREVEIECLPGDIPSHLDVNVSGLEINGAIHVSDLPHSGSIKFLGDEHATVAHVTVMREEVVAEPAAAAAAAEPEVAKKGKQDAEAAAPAADAKGAKKWFVLEGSGVKLIVGLGNPGIEYQFTPHNAGFLALDRIAEDCGVQLANRRGRALTARAKLAGQDVLLAKPETFMNLSGLSVRALLDELALDASEMLVIYDELAIPLGALRIRERGSAGGHNGAKSISGVLGTEEWLRVRIGVGKPPLDDGREIKAGGKEYLLSPMRRQELAVLDEVLDRAKRAVEMVLTKGVGAAMSEFNRRPEDEPAA